MASEIAVIGPLVAAMQALVLWYFEAVAGVRHSRVRVVFALKGWRGQELSLIHISEPTRLALI
eukprot:11211516-Alexandrium_andersonii.AAC.1